MPKQLLEITKFMNGTVTTPDDRDTPEQSASYSLNLDCVNKDGVLQGTPLNSDITVHKNASGTTASDVDFDKAAVIKTLKSDNTTQEDVITWENDQNKLRFIQDAAATNPLLDPNGTPFATDGIGYSDVRLEDVAMETNNKEVHIGLGKANRPQWAGYTNHAGVVYEAGKLIVEDAEVKYPSSIPYMHKVVRAGNDGYIYGIERGGTRIWKIDGTNGTKVSTSIEGTFENLKSIATDGSGNLFVLDKVGTGKVYKVATSNLDEASVTYTLPTTYPGPSGSQYSDIEYTSTNTTLWIASHYDNRFNISAQAADQLIWKFTAGGSDATVTLTNMMPRMSGNSDGAQGTWVITQDQNTNDAIDDDEFSPTSNTIQETFPRCLLKHGSDNAAIYWLARYQNTGDDGIDFGVRWLTKPASGNVTGSTPLANVESVSAPITLGLHRIKNDHSTASNNGAATDFVPIYNVYHPAGANGSVSAPGQGVATFTPINIDSIGINDDNTEIYLTIGSTIQKLSGDIDVNWTTPQTSGNYNKYHLVSADAVGPTNEIQYSMTPSGQVARTGVKVNFGYIPSTANVGNAYSADGTNMVMLRQSGTAGFDTLSKTFNDTAVLTLKKDHSVIGLAITDQNNTTSELKSGYTYFYKLTMLYDGYQETPLSTETFVDTNSTTKNNELAITINDKTQISDRVSAIKIYRAENTSSAATAPVSVYRLIKQLEVSTGWQDSGTVVMTKSITDTGIKGASFEAESGLPETLSATLPHYSLSAQLNNQHYIGKCNHEGYIDDASSYIFVSKVGKFDVFDWLLDFIKLPTIPTTLISFAGRIFAFDENNTYRIRGGNDLYIEDIFEGVGCLNDDAIVATDFGLFFADNNNIYQHNGRSAEPIGEAIVRGDSTYSWQNRDTSYYTRAMYDAKRRSVYFTFKIAGSNKYYVWAWNIPRKRWDMLSFGNTDVIGSNSFDQGDYEPRGTYLLTDNSINVSYKDLGAGTSKITKFLGSTASNKRGWTWVSKDLTMNYDTQEKNIKQILSSDRIKIATSLNGTLPNAGSQLADTLIKGTYRKDVKTKSTTLKVRVDSVNSVGEVTTDECKSLGILFKTKRSPK